MKEAPIHDHPAEVPAVHCGLPGRARRRRGRTRPPSRLRPHRPALLLSSGTDGIWLSSNGLPVLPAPARQPGSLDRLAAFADQRPPATPWLEQAQLLHTETPLAAVLPLVEPTRRPLLEQLRAGAAAGAT